MNAIPSWVWLATAAALPILVIGGTLAAGICIGGTKLRRAQPRPCADEQYGPEDEARDPGDLMHEPPAPIRIHPNREAP